MTRLYGQSRHDLVEVRRRDDVPDQFLWRGRLYVVRAVLARWTEAGGWWRGEAGPSLDDHERDWWRVEADSGRHEAMTAGPGVYDLCFDWSQGSWRLARVMD